MKFWDGHPLTAADVAYSLNYDRAAGSDVAFAFADVKSVTATDPSTVTVTLTAPDASWKYVPAEENAYIFEKQFQQAHASTFGQPGTLVMGSGPWVIDSLDPTKGAQVTANPHWWGGKVAIKRIAFTFYATETSEALAFRAGEIDLDPGISSPKSFAATSGAKLLSTPGCSNGFFGMNVTQPGWNDVHVRRAVAYALNRTDIIAAYGGYATPIYTLTPPQLLASVASKSQVDGLLNSIPLYQYNLDKARQEMSESAYPHGFSAVMDIDNYGTDPDVDQVIAAELAKIGIKLELKELNVTVWQGIENGPAAKRSTAFGGGGCFQPDPNTYSDFLGSKNLADRRLELLQLRARGRGQPARAGGRDVQPGAALRRVLQALRAAAAGRALRRALRLRHGRRPVGQVQLAGLQPVVLGRRVRARHQGCLTGPGRTTRRPP